MNHQDSPLSERELLTLQAYHDGELSRWGRWRFERALRRRAELRRELAKLRRLAGSIREIESQRGPVELPDIWSDIGSSLSRIDVEAGRARGRDVSRTRDAWSWGSLLASGAVAAGVLAVIALDNGKGIPEHPAANPTEAIAGGSLRYLQTHGVSYVVSQDTKDVTIIWLMDAPEVAGGA